MQESIFYKKAATNLCIFTFAIDKSRIIVYNEPINANKTHCFII